MAFAHMRSILSGKVRIPRNSIQAEWGDRIAPAPCRSRFKNDHRSLEASAHDNTPAITSECPLIAFVAECMTMSAPNEIGCIKTGVAAVASTANNAPADFATFEIASMSLVKIQGFEGTSIKIRSGFSDLSKSVKTSVSLLSASIKMISR